MRTIIYCISDLVCVGILRSSLWTIEDEITNNVIPIFGGNTTDYTSIEVNDEIIDFHLENINNVITVVKNQPNLLDIKQQAINNIKISYTTTLNAGFSSTATGMLFSYNYSDLDQMKFMKLAIDVANTTATFPVPIPCNTGILVMHDQTQYEQLVKDIHNFEWGLQNKLHDYISQIQNASSIDDVNNIVSSVVWS